MDPGKLQLFDMMKTKLDWLAQRQRVLAQNVANADTPDYDARDLKALDFGQIVRKHRKGANSNVSLNITSGSHIGGKSKGTFRQENSPTRFDITPIDNSVTLEEQMLQQSQTAEQYKLTTTLYTKYTGLMKTAVRGPGG